LRLQPNAGLRSKSVFRAKPIQIACGQGSGPAVKISMKSYCESVLFERPMTFGQLSRYRVESRPASEQIGQRLPSDFHFTPTSTLRRQRQRQAHLHGMRTKPYEAHSPEAAEKFYLRLLTVRRAQRLDFALAVGRRFASIRRCPPRPQWQM
jgi:hypothetical protein